MPPRLYLLSLYTRRLVSLTGGKLRTIGFSFSSFPDTTAIGQSDWWKVTYPRCSWFEGKVVSHTVMHEFWDGFSFLLIHAVCFFLSVSGWMGGKSSHFSFD